MHIRKIVIIKEQYLMEGRNNLPEKVDKIGVMAVVKDPHPMEYIEDLQE